MCDKKLWVRKNFWSKKIWTGGKQSQLLLQPTKVELGLQVRLEFDKNSIYAMLI